MISHPRVVGFARLDVENPSIAALSSGNLGAVARAMRKRFPAAQLVLAADLVKTTGAADSHAVEAAQAVGAVFVAPDFGDDRAASFAGCSHPAATSAFVATRASKPWHTSRLNASGSTMYSRRHRGRHQAHA